MIAVLWGCGEAPEPSLEPPDPLPPEEVTRALQIGAPAAAALADGLVQALSRAIEEEGVAGAVAFCADEALPLTAGVGAAHDPPLGLKRTTLRWRNPTNAPDAWEERILRHLESLQAMDPEGLPGELTGRGPDGSLRYYRALRTAPMCLSCHGDPESTDPDVREILMARYPEDRAMGYEAGEFRGVIRVEIPPEDDAR